MISTRRALISVHDKRGLLEFARGLLDSGFELISTGGTQKALEAGGIRVRLVSELTGLPEVLDGRVKTLHPAIHAGILFRRSNPAHLRQLESVNGCPIDMVVVNLYPFEATVFRENATLEDAIENLDIGGPTLIRAAAKNFEDVAVVVNPDRYESILAELVQNGGHLSRNTRLQLATEAFEHTARYDSVVAGYFGDQLRTMGLLGALPAQLCLTGRKVAELRYGENPHQAAALYAEPGPPHGVISLEQLWGKELSFNNINDINAAIQLCNEFEAPAAVAVKHATPCGVALGLDISDAFSKAYDADPVSIFGGIVALNRAVDEPTARRMSEIFLEVVAAPAYEDEALEVLRQKKNLRLLRAHEQTAARLRLDIKKVAGGYLVQQADVGDSGEKLIVVTKRAPTPEETSDLLFAWSVAKHVRSNAIVVAKHGQTLGIGGGQVNRIDPARYSLKRAKDLARGAVLASDGFFPMPDVVEEAVAAGISAIIQPGGSIRDADSIEVADRAGVAMVFTGVRHFKH